MSAWRWRWVVLVPRPSMEQVLVGHELNVSDVEFHMQCEAIACILKDLDSVGLLRGKGWDDAFV